MPDDLTSLVPRHKKDFERVIAVEAAGYPAAAPILLQLMEWVQDLNWPIAPRVARFLAGGGHAALPAIRRVLASNDGCWKYWCLTAVVRCLPPAVLAELGDDLGRIVASPTDDETIEEVVPIARELLGLIRGQQHP